MPSSNRSPLRLAVVGACLLVLHAAHAADPAPSKADVCVSSDNGECSHESNTPPVCSLYMAPSSIPGAGIGIFTGVERQEGDVVGKGDIILPLSDLSFHFSANANYRGAVHYDPTRDYVWAGGQMGVQFESAAEGTGVSAFVPGLDCVINCHLGLLNVRSGDPKFDSGDLHRSRDPGTGAFSPYFNSTAFVKHAIPAGGELFKDYGDQWFRDRRYKLGLIPLRDDYRAAEEYVNEFKAFVASNTLEPEVVSDLWQLMVDLPFRTGMFNALPPDMERLEVAHEKGIRAIHQASGMRQVAELDRIGRCLDKIHPENLSTLSQAGRGAFASRHIEKGEVVIGTPLLFTPTDDFFRMYEGNWLMQGEAPDREKLKQMQLGINYSWKHPESSLFLIPYGPLVQFINHNQTQANVRMQWAKDGEMSHHSNWLELPPEEIFPRTSPGLFLDFVATRDVQPGEEIFLDYGDAWENAWIDHVTTWKPPKDSLDYVSARTWVAANADTILRTEKEQEADPYPANFEMRCLHDIIMKNPTKDEAKSKWGEKAESMICTVQERRETDGGQVLYMVHYLPLGFVEDEDTIIDGMVNWYESDYIVREAITFVESAYTSDIFLDGAFRHPIGIPDDIFPKAWRGFQGTLY